MPFKRTHECLEAAIGWADFIKYLYERHKEIRELTLQDIFDDPTAKTNLSDEEIENFLFDQDIFKYFELKELMGSLKDLDTTIFYSALNWLKLELSFVENNNYDTVLEQLNALINIVSTIKLFCSDCATWIINICEALGINYLDYYPAENKNVEFGIEEEVKEPLIEAYSITYEFPNTGIGRRQDEG